MSKLPGDRRKRNHDQWSREKMVKFLRELAASQNVSQAARSVGMSRQSAYRLRNRIKGSPFDLGWEVALEMGYHQLAHALMDRAVNGEEVPHYHGGEQVGSHRKFDNRLGQWILENPWKLGRMQISREYTAPAFEALLERIEWASVHWEAGESLPVNGDPIEHRPDGEAREENFIRKDSWYAAEVADAEPPRGRRRF